MSVHCVIEVVNFAAITKCICHHVVSRCNEQFFMKTSVKTQACIYSDENHTSP